MTCDDTSEGGVNHEVSGSTSLRCACHSCDWPSCPPACGGMRRAHRHEGAEGARWGGWARRTGVRVAVGVPSPPPGDYTGHDRTESKVTHGATTHARGNHHLAQSNSAHQLSGQRESATCCYRVTDTSNQRPPLILSMSRAGSLSTQLKLVTIHTTTGDTAGLQSLFFSN